MISPKCCPTPAPRESSVVADVSRHLGELPDGQRKVVHCIAVNGASIDEAAARLSMTNGAVASPCIAASPRSPSSFEVTSHEHQRTDRRALQRQHPAPAAGAGADARALIPGVVIALACSSPPSASGRISSRCLASLALYSR